MTPTTKPMDDRELLELAAKAYRDPSVKPGQPEFTRWIGHNEDLGCDVLVPWNPLTDDGDALRLAVKVNLHFSALNHSAIASHDSSLVYVQIEYGDDKCAATRRAIVRAAAEIARQENGNG